MGDPHNPQRYGEAWPQYKIDAYLEALAPLRPYVLLSGGWAWHFLSPSGHPEYKHAHDHKDVDLMVPPAHVGVVVGLLKAGGFDKVRTRYDRLPSEEDFRRYERVIEGDEPPFRLTVDFFVKELPALETPSGWRVVRPDVLLGLYAHIHSSDKAWAVQAAARILEGGAAPEALIGEPRLALCPERPARRCEGCGWVGQSFIEAKPDREPCPRCGARTREEALWAS